MTSRRSAEIPSAGSGRARERARPHARDAGLEYRVEVSLVATLRDIVYQQVREGELYEKLDRDRVRCYACGHCCPIPEGQPGVCKVRYNRGGTLYVPWGYVGGVQCDPIEKKPFFHAYPGALAYSFGMLGCDLHCSYCQNWVTSQALRDPEAVSSPLDADRTADQRRDRPGRKGYGQHL